jgi:hypothetical protein
MALPLSMRAGVNSGAWFRSPPPDRGEGDESDDDDEPDDAHAARAIMGPSTLTKRNTRIGPFSGSRTMLS